MFRGTTNRLNITIEGVDVKEIKEIWLTFSAEEKLGTEIFTKKKEDLIFDEDGTIICDLTQEETLDLNKYSEKNKCVYVQARLLMNDGMALASPISTMTVNAVLKDGVIQ